MALLEKNKKADTQNGFGTASSFQNQPENANWGNFGNDYGNTNGNPFVNNYGNGADNFGGSPFGGTGSFGGNDGFGTVNYNMTGGRPSLQQKTETHFSKSFLIVSIIASVIFFLLGEVIYRTLITDITFSKLCCPRSFSSPVCTNGISASAVLSTIRSPSR